MTTKIDGNNGVLQSYDYQVLTTGFTYTFASGTTTLIINPAGTLATGTITMPASPADGMVITIESTQQVTAVTVAANTGQTLVGAASQLIPNQPLSFIYRLTNTTWYPMAGGAGRATAVVSGTSVASTSGTSIDFTGIPSWVKRITVMLSGVSTNGTVSYQVQIGSGSITATGYVSQSVSATDGAFSTLATSTVGFIIRSGSATNAYYGHMVLTNISGTTWVASHVASTAGGASVQGGGVSPAIGGAVDRIRLTTTTGVDTFDAGSINILYE
jgi:hypothetical protein